MRALGSLAAAAVLLTLPFWVGSNFYVDVLTEILIAAILAASYNLLIGYGGLLSLGHGAFYGLAGYMVTIASVTYGYSHAAAIAAALLGSLLVSAVVSVFVLRTVGLSLTMTTLAIGQLFWGISARWVGVTGGDSGLPGLQRPKPFGVDLAAPAPFYFATLAVSAMSLALIWRFVKSPFGVCLQGVRDQPRRMEALGHNVWLMRYIALVYAAFWSAVAGIMSAYFQKFVSPYNLGVEQAVAPLIMVILGGVTTATGPLLGAVMVIVVQRVVSTYVDAWPTLLGICFILTVLFAPKGLSHLVATGWHAAAARLQGPRPARTVQEKVL